MRLAVISDIHGNDVALEAAVADIDRSHCARIVCLGDAVQGGPQPAEVVKRLREREIPTVMGNADSWLLTGLTSDAEKISESRMRKKLDARKWSLAQLAVADTEFVSSFEPTIRIQLGDAQSILCYHGSPKSFDDVLLPDSPLARFEEVLPLGDATYFAGGHTHVQFVRQLGLGFHFNPGSIGAAYRHNQPEDRVKFDSFAEYAILHSEGGRLGLEFRRVPFDADRLIRIYLNSGWPHPEDAIDALSDLPC